MGLPAAGFLAVNFVFCYCSGELLTLALVLRGGPLEGPRMDTQKMPEAQRSSEGARRPYERPGIHWEEDFLPYVYSTCMKLPSQGGGCAVGGGSS